MINHLNDLVFISRNKFCLGIWGYQISAGGRLVFQFAELYRFVNMADVYPEALPRAVVVSPSKALCGGAPNSYVAPGGETQLGLN